MNAKDFQQKHIVVLGAARSGLAVSELLKNAGGNVFVSDFASAADKKETIQVLEGLGVPFEFGQHSERVFLADFVVLSPGISQETEIVRKIRERNIPVYSELEVASWFCRQQIIAVTGSNGKTTTTTLLGEMLRTADSGAIVAGNIGAPLSLFAGKETKLDWAAVEVSSFQLETIDRFHPKITILLNLAPNHLDWYASFEDYIRAKMRILKNLTSDDFIVYNSDDDLLKKNIRDSVAKKLSFSAHTPKCEAFLDADTLYVQNREVVRTQEMQLRGVHNYTNALAAALAAQITGINEDQIRQVLREFRGVVHRLEFVRTIDGVHFINDSKATTLESLAAALNSFEKKIILIAGGKDKGSDFSRITGLLKEKVRAAILIGQSRHKIYESWNELVPLQMAESLQQAAEMALQTAHPGEFVVLSPACSSFDMFTDYEDRGNTFKQIINELSHETDEVKK